MSRNVTGILGGMGPEATILLQQRILGRVPAADDADHLPLLIDMNPQVPSRIAHLIEGTGVDPTPVLTEMAKRLQAAGATALAMPCNTAHHYAPQIQAAVSIPLLNMIDLSVARAPQMVAKGANVGILASPAVQMAKVFDPALQAAGLSAFWPKDADKMLAAIRDIKANGATPHARCILSDAATELAENGAGLLFIACSEFSLLTATLTAPVRIIDTIDVLAAAIHQHSLLKPR
jgi:aspartate racemase